MTTSRRRRRRTVVIVLAALGVVVVGATVWIGVRGVLARDALAQALPLVGRLQSQVVAGHTADLGSTVAQLQHATRTAADLTSDPIWRAGELVPVLGTNLTAVREAAAAADGVAHQVAPVLVDLGGRLDAGSLLPKNGALDPAAISAAAPAVQTASRAMSILDARIDRIPTGGTIPAVSDAVGRLRTASDRAASLLSGLSAAARVLPAMLGTEGERRYLLLVQNNAELRSDGGIPGAVAVVTADHGALALETQSAAFGFPRPVLPLSAGEQGLYGDNLGRYLQNVTMTPDFARSGLLAQTMWRDRTGETVDGVIAVDPVALSAVLAVTGPVRLPDGTVLDRSDAVSTLLSGTYERFADPAAQDAFFAGAARAVFDRVVSGRASPTALARAVGDAATQGRILVWSAHPEEQRVVAAAGVADLLPRAEPSRTELGVYLVDNTEAKMDYYLRSAIGVSAAMCRADGRPLIAVGVDLTSVAPQDAATALPGYVTGGRRGLGVEKGEIRTTAYLYAPPGSDIYDVRVDGRSRPFIAAVDAGRPAAGITTTVAPGQVAHVTFLLVARRGTPVETSVRHTPTAFGVPVTHPRPPACSSPTPAAPNALGTAAGAGRPVFGGRAAVLRHPWDDTAATRRRALASLPLDAAIRRRRPTSSTL